jgi:hypothetical protein
MGDLRTRCGGQRWQRGAAALLVCMAAAIGCEPQRPADSAVGGAPGRCTIDDPRACEQAILAAKPAEVPSLLERYDRALGLPAEGGGPGASWSGIWAWLQASPDRLALALDAAAQAPGREADEDRLTLSDGLEPRSLGTRRQLWLALGDKAGRRRVILLAHDGARAVAWHLYGRDPLGPHLLGLEGVAAGSAEPARLAHDLGLDRLVNESLLAAGSFDYAAAATKAEQLRSLLAAAPAAGDEEPTLRARCALRLLETAGIALERPAGETVEPSAGPRVAPPHPGGAPGSAQADLIRVQLADEGFEAQWSARRANIVAGLSQDRVAMLDELYRPADRCPSFVAPPMDRPGDLLFGRRLAMAFDPDPARRAGQASGTRGLGIDEWLPRYEALVRMVDETGTTWAMAPTLLAERGALHGLSAEGTATYRRVTELTLRHVAALSALATAYPARFRSFGGLPLAYEPGVSRDRRVRDALMALAQTQIALKLDTATTVGELWDGTVAPAMAAMSFPQPMQGAEMAALRDALAAKLDGRLGAERGWQPAGLHACLGLLGLLTGQPERVKQVAPRVAQSLAGGPELPYPALAAVTRAATYYVSLLGEAALDPTVNNPTMFARARKAAYAELSTALTHLSDPGPTTGAERDLLRDAAELADGLLAVLARELTADAAANPKPSCGGEKTLGDSAPLGDAFRRLERKRRLLLARPAFERGDSVWLRRARLVVLVLSDALDLAQKHGPARPFLIPEARGEQILEQALRDWNEPAWAAAARGGYLGLRGMLDPGADRAKLGADTALLLQGLARAFAPEAGAKAPHRSLFAVLAEASADPSARSSGGPAELADLLVSYARRSYAEGADAQGDLFLLLVLGVGVAREAAVPDAAVALARERGRAVGLPLLLQAHRYHDAEDPEPVFAAMRSAGRGHCAPPSPEPIITLERAIHDFKAGRRRQARAALDGFLRDAESNGLTVPRLIYTYEETTQDKIFRLEESLSLGAELLSKSGSFQLGLGFRGGGKEGGELKARFAEAGGRGALEEAARIYAHAAALGAVFHELDGAPDAARGAAEQAVAAYVVGVRLGQDLVPSGEQTATWAADAVPVLALAAQLSAEAGRAFVAGDLWTLVRAAVGPSADQATLDALLSPLPPSLHGLPELDPLVARAKRSLAVVTSGLPCMTPRSRERAASRAFLQADCDGYPLALSYRIAGGLPALPHLRRGAELGNARCAAWRAVDELLSALGEKRYDPDALTKAVSALAAAGDGADAAALLARHRHPDHCSPALLDQARVLGGDVALGPGLRADLQSIVLNCSSSQIDAPFVQALTLLDDLTQRQPVPVRNLQVVLFAVRLGLTLDRWEPIAALARTPNFVQRWLPFGPELATAALLIQHAAVVSVGETVDAVATLPLYRLLCTTFPPADRGTSCNALAVLRSGGASSDRKRAAREALTMLLSQLTGPPTAEQRGAGSGAKPP